VHLTALVEHQDHVCCRYRLVAFRPFLERTGHTLELIALPRLPWERIWLYRRLRGAAVVLQRKLLPRWEIALLRWSARTLVFDFDDAVFLRDSYAAKGLHTLATLRRHGSRLRRRGSWQRLSRPQRLALDQPWSYLCRPHLRRSHPLSDGRSSAP